MTTSSLQAPVYLLKDSTSLSRNSSSFLTMNPQIGSTILAELPRPPQSPRHFFEKLYGHLETTVTPTSPEITSHIGQLTKHEVDSVVLSRGLMIEHHNSQLDLMAGRSSVHSPPQHSNMSGSSADVSDTR